MSAVQPIPFDKYLLLDRIAVGGMAEVYRGKLIGEKGFEKPVVLKKMHPHLTDEEQMVELFIDEARLAAQLKHENIIHIYDFGNNAGTLYIAMEYLFGKDLHQVIHKAKEAEKPLPLEIILHLILKVCEGLGYAHGLRDLQENPLNIIHRDVSPQNIFITYDGQVKLIDFGIAKAASKATKTQTGIIKGKVSYMSPEQASGKTIDHRSDIFSVGIILYELATGTKMFQGETFQVLAQVIEAKYNPPKEINDDLPEGLCRIIEKALQSDPDTRYQSCEEMVSDLENLLYEMKYRPSTKRLSAYLLDLYKESVEREKTEMAQRLSGQTGQLNSGARSASADQGTVSVAPEPQKGYQPTEVIHSETVPSDEKPTVVAPQRSGKKAYAVFAAVFIAVGLLAAGLTGKLFFKKSHEINKNIIYLIEKAEDSTLNERIIFPIEDNSLYYYHEVLKIDPTNEQALQGKTNAISYCIGHAKEDIAIDSNFSAIDYIDTCMEFDPENNQLRELRLEASRNRVISSNNKSVLGKLKGFITQ